MRYFIMTETRWEHFSHAADIGVRGFGSTMAAAFEQAACAMFAAVTDLATVEEVSVVTVACEAPTDALLLVDWLNALIYEMAIRRMLFRRFAIETDGRRLSGRAWGERIDPARHHPAVEPKGATLTELHVERLREGGWIAQCVVDV